MPHLVLIRHAAPVVTLGMDANDWPLSAEGRAGAAAFAENLAAYQPSHVVSSVEPKAAETAGIIAARLGVPVETVPGLHEHDRHGMGLLGREGFEAAVARFFASPTELVLGGETAHEANERFWQAVTGIIARADAERDILVVTHGTVLSLFAARAAGADPLALWRSLRLPDAVTFSLPELRLVPLRAEGRAG
ncbi:MAG TPA: histidine phosphatase family protein [Ktedonobacterales bacterium]|nr:histidine phosphatase family protein [Ktedonobacterales bacterium]